MRVLLSAVLVVGILLAGGFAAIQWEQANFIKPGSLPDEKIVVIDQGTSLQDIAARLERESVIQNALLFRIGVFRRNRHSALKAGEYEFPAHASMSDAMRILVDGKVVEHRITIAEGLTSKAALETVEEDPVLTGDAGGLPPEGTLLPETYNFHRGATRADMVARMRKALDTTVASLWAKRKPGLPLSTPEEAVTLASIVEKETALPAERPRIAAIFINRLNAGMKLESDPTIIYGLTGGAPLGHPLRQSELAQPNPYSTYQISGLPPTPICNPGKEAIAAVLNPPDTEELFFVADGTGGHAFAKTGAEHMRNVARLRQLEQRSKAN